MACLFLTEVFILSACMRTLYPPELKVVLCKATTIKLESTDFTLRGGKSDLPIPRIKRRQN